MQPILISPSPNPDACDEDDHAVATTPLEGADWMPIPVRMTSPVRLPLPPFIHFHSVVEGGGGGEAMAGAYFTLSCASKQTLQYNDVLDIPTR
jgi:hypothetical protein